MSKIVFTVEDEACHSDLEVLQPNYKFKLVHEGDTLEEHVEAFKMVLRAIGHCEDNVSRIQYEGFEQRLARHKEENGINEIKDKLYNEYLNKRGE